MIDPKKLIGFIYRSSLEMPEKVRLSSLVIYGDEKMHQKIFFILQQIMEPPDLENKKREISRIRKELFRAGEEAVKKIEEISMRAMEKNFL